MALIPLVKINGTIKNTKIKKNIRFTWKPLREKTKGMGETFTINLRNYKVQLIRDKP